MSEKLPEPKKEVPPELGKLMMSQMPIEAWWVNTGQEDIPKWGSEALGKKF